MSLNCQEQADQDKVVRDELDLMGIIFTFYIFLPKREAEWGPNLYQMENKY